MSSRDIGKRKKKAKVGPKPVREESSVEEEQEESEEEKGEIDRKDKIMLPNTLDSDNEVNPEADPTS